MKLLKFESEGKIWTFCQVNVLDGLGSLGQDRESWHGRIPQTGQQIYNMSNLPIRHNKLWPSLDNLPLFTVF